MKIGYARIDSSNENLENQLQALKQAGCRWVFREHVFRNSKSSQKRTEFERMLLKIKAGDVVVVQKLDRIGQSLEQLTELLEFFDEQKIGFVSLYDKIDTTGSEWNAIIPLLKAILEFNRNLKSASTKSGLQRAKNRGIRLGKKPGLSEETKQKAQKAKKLYKKDGLSIKRICLTLEISRSTFYRYINY
jgi:DNA invertase Pin-like site-specific DNA recombinase